MAQAFNAKPEQEREVESGPGDAAAATSEPRNKGRTSIQEIRSAELIEAAKQCLADLGLDDTTVRDVAAYAGASPSSVTYYFGSKEELVVKAMSEATDAFRREAEDAIAAETTALAKLERLVGLLLEPRPGMDVNWRLWLDLRPHAVRQAWVRDVYTRKYDEWLAFVEQLISDGVASGEFRVLEARAAAEVLSSAIDGVAFYLLLESSTDASAVISSCKSLVRSFLAHAS